jgi:methylase of polypeptide subunit release factors
LVTGRHESGSYYTPKPVVAFMGQEALKGYLETACPGESATAIAAFVEQRDATGLRNPERVLEALKTVKICDPACGSGAYLLGMLHELLDLRSALFAARKLDHVTAYQRKLEIIQNNLYGVDLDPFAINIARLRLWLSLIVEFEGNNPPPLPNLDFKIEAGDSLTAPDPSGGLQPDMFRQQQVAEYFRLKGEYLQTHGPEKLTLRREIDELRANIVTWAHPKGGSEGFDWAVVFAEVFAGPQLAASTLGGDKQSGFDIILANPLYVRHELLGSDYKAQLKPIYPEAYTGTADLYVYFYSRTLQLLKPGGMLAFISSNKFMRAGYGERLRQLLTKKTTLQTIVDFGDLPIFEATTYPAILIARKRLPAKDEVIKTLTILDMNLVERLSDVVNEQAWLQPQCSLRTGGWTMDSLSAIAMRTSHGQSIGLSIVMILAGVLAIALYPLLLGIMDDCSRLCCHAQWYLTEAAEEL